MSTIVHYMGSNHINPHIASFAANAFEGYTMDALNGIINSVPKWHTLLDNLNSQISLRQFELAQLDENRPPTRSLKPKGSTESLLRPKEVEEHPILDGENINDAPKDSADPPTLTKNTVFPTPSTPARPTQHITPNGSPPRLFHHSSSPGPAPLQRRTSQRLNTPNNATKPTILRKRKTESIASGESQAPKYRTRSMIIVYYDSAVQIAFEELVKFISASRNAMRKGKMAARMADMKKMAEMETETDDEEDEGLSAAKKALNGIVNGNGHTVAPIKNGLARETGDSELPRLEFVSTRKMGPSRDSPVAAALRSVGGPQMAGMGRRMLLSRISAPGSFSSIFDELDTGLEWCQSMCEHAAHQFLREGNCDTEIAGIKKRLCEVKEIAEREAAKQKQEEKQEKLGNKGEEKEEAMNEKINCVRRPEEYRGVKSIQVRKSVSAVRNLEADCIEVDDEGYNDALPKLQWRSAEQKVP